MAIIEQIKDLINRVENKKDSKDSDGRWVTIKGTHVFIPEGKQIEDVMKEKGWVHEGKSSTSKPDEDNLKGKYERDDVEFDEKQAKKDIAAARKLGHKDIDDVAEFLGLDPDEVIELTGESYDDDIDDELVTVEKADPEAIKRNKETNDRWQKAIKETAAREGWDKPDTPDEFEQIKSSIDKYFKSDANDKSVSVKELNKTFSLHQYNVDDIIDAAKEAGYEVKDDVIYRKDEQSDKKSEGAGKKKSKDKNIKNSLSARTQNSLVEVIADAICDEVCNSTDFFE